MYLLYLDASGTPSIRDHTNIYALVGICAHEGTWFALERRVTALKKKYQFPGSPFELHAKDFCMRCREQEQIPGFAKLSWEDRRTEVFRLRQTKLAKYTDDRARRKRKLYRATEPFVHLTRRERGQLLDEVLELVGSHRRLKLFGEAIDKQYLNTQGGRPVIQAFSQVVSRFDRYLQNVNRKGRVNKGLLVMDREPASETRYRELLEKFRSTGHPWGEVKHVLEVPFFVDSELANVVQLVDSCAYVVRRHIETPDSKIDRYRFEKIFPKFDRAKNRLHGLRHYCRPHQCDCLVCTERGFGANP